MTHSPFFLYLLFLIIYAQVRFPLDDLDLSPYVASAAAVQRERDKEVGRMVDQSDEEGVKHPSSLPSSSPSTTDAAATTAAATGVTTCSFLPSTSSSSQYTLYAIIHHVGAMQAGHYVATVRVEQGGKWYCFNDSRVRIHLFFLPSLLPPFAFPPFCSLPFPLYVYTILYSHSHTNNQSLAFTIIPPPPHPPSIPARWKRCLQRSW